MRTKQSMAVWDDFSNGSPLDEKERSNDPGEVYYRPFVYATQSRTQRWARKFGFGLGLLKGKWLKLLLGH